MRECSKFGKRADEIRFGIFAERTIMETLSIGTPTEIGAIPSDGR